MKNFEGIEERGGRKQRIWNRIAVLRGRRRLASYAGEMAQHTQRVAAAAAAAAALEAGSPGRLRRLAGMPSAEPLLGSRDHT